MNKMECNLPAYFFLKYDSPAFQIANNSIFLTKKLFHDDKHVKIIIIVLPCYN